MPEDSVKKRPVAIECALGVIKQQKLDSTIGSSYLEWLEKQLPALSMALSRAGEQVTAELLNKYIAQGQEHIEHYLHELRQQKPNKQKKPFSYEDVVKSLEKPVEDKQEVARDNSFVNGPDGDDLEKLKEHIERSSPSRIQRQGRLDLEVRYAAKLGKFDVVELLISLGADIHIADDEALRLAVGAGYYDVMELLLENGANVQADDNYALCHAVDNGNYKVAKLLLEHGANANDINDRRGLPLVRAALDGDIKLLELLLDHGADVLWRDSWALGSAACWGHYDCVELLLRRGAEVSGNDTGALWMAADNGHYEVVQLLLEKGADIHACYDLALQMAAKKGHFSVVKLLFENGANVDANGGNYPKEVVKGGHLKTMGLLLEKGLKFEFYGETLLVVAAQEGHSEIIELLLDCGANIHIMYDQALEYAARHGHCEVAQLLLERGAELHVRDDIALRTAADCGHVKVAELLLDHGADIHAGRDQALNRAACNGHYAMMRMLLKRGAKSSVLLPQHIDGLAKYEEWGRLHKGFLVPGSLIDKDPRGFKMKTYQATLAMFEAEGYTGVTAEQYAYHVSMLFRTEDRVLRYLQKWGDAGKQPLHDIVRMVYLPADAAIDYKAWGDAVLQHGPDMARLVKFANRIEQPEKSTDGKLWSLTKTKAQVAQFVFSQASQNPKLAALCFEFEWDEDEFDDALSQVEKYKKLFKAHGMKKPSGKIPDIEVDGAAFEKPDYHLYKLPDGDVRGLLLGEFTDCCQHLANAGAECAKHGFLSENGGFYVVAHKETDEIIGQSWAWRGKKDELVFDSLESLRGRFNAQNWQDLSSTFADQVEKDNSAVIKAIHIGGGGATPRLEHVAVHHAEHLATPKDYDGYRDSAHSQFIVRDFTKVPSP